MESASNMRFLERSLTRNKPEPSRNEPPRSTPVDIPQTVAPQSSNSNAPRNQVSGLFGKDK